MGLEFLERAIQDTGTDGLGGHRDIHGAPQGKPATRASAKSRYLPFRIDHRRLGMRKKSTGGSQAYRDHSLLDVARSDGSHHVVTAAGADQDSGRHSPLPGQVRAQAAGGPMRLHESRQARAQVCVGVDPVQSKPPTTRVGAR